MEFINLKSQYKALKPEIIQRVDKVISEGRFIMGAEVKELEDRLSAYVGVKHVIACGSGTDALQLLYMAYGIGIGDAIFVPDLTFIATHESACMLGATAIFCDIDSKTYNIDPVALEEKILQVQKQGKLIPRCIVAVDFLGNPCDFEAICKIAKKYDLLLFEDAAQGMGAVYHDKKCCSFGQAAATSFFPAKPLGCYGDGGAVFTNDDSVAAIVRSLQVHGKGEDKYDNIRIGINSRLDTMQAAVLLVKLDHLEEEIIIRQKKSEIYDLAFINTNLVTPFIVEQCHSAYAQYALLAKDNIQRDIIMEALQKQNIPTLVYYPHAMHQLPVFQENPSALDGYPNAEDYVERTFALPFSAYLEEEEQNIVIRAVLGALQ
jgi:UDP-2-acetamido-2-deoxy-ribo-hexuluronate aminotransferase